MSNRRVLTVTAGLLAAFATSVGCGNERPPSAPSPALRVTSVSPNSGIAGASTSVQILGDGFQSGATVTFDGAAATVTALSTAAITATAPIRSAGLVDVVVTNPGGQSERLTRGFTYVALDPPSVLTLSPTKGSTSGGTTVTITGSGFRPGTAVMLADERQDALIESSTTIRLTTSAHEVGAVAITIANPDGQVVRLSDRYTYAAPQSFDFNGVWDGYALAHPDALGRTAPRHSDMEMQFTIENNVLTRLVCGGAPLPFAVAPNVKEGAFSQADGNRVVITGRIVADGNALGTIDTDACPATRWAAVRR